MLGFDDEEDIQLGDADADVVVHTYGNISNEPTASLNQPNDDSDVHRPSVGLLQELLRQLPDYIASNPLDRLLLELYEECWVENGSLILELGLEKINFNVMDERANKRALALLTTLFVGDPGENAGVVLIGKMRVGKSTLGNIITGAEDYFAISNGITAGTSEVEYKDAHLDTGLPIRVVDTVGLMDNQGNDAMIELFEAVAILGNEASVVFIVISALEALTNDQFLEIRRMIRLFDQTKKVLVVNKAEEPIRKGMEEEWLAMQMADAPKLNELVNLCQATEVVSGMDELKGYTYELLVRHIVRKETELVRVSDLFRVLWPAIHVDYQRCKMKWIQQRFNDDFVKDFN